MILVPTKPHLEGESKIEKFLDLMKTFGVMDLTRTGKVAMPRKAEVK